MRKNLIVLVVMMWCSGVLLSQETWVRTFGGSESERGYSISVTSNSGYVLTGTTESDDNIFTSMNRGKEDIFVITISSRGDSRGVKIFGGSGSDNGESITTTSRRGIVVTGQSNSNDGDFEGMNSGGSDIFVFKLDSRGEVEWKRTYGGSSDDGGTSISTTPDGGFVITGYTQSNDDDFEGMNKGGEDIFVIKLDSLGEVQWRKTFGGWTDDRGNSIINTLDGGFVLTGSTSSNDGDFKGMDSGGSDIIVMKLDSRGEVQWRRSLGGWGDDYGVSIITSTDGGYVVTGNTESNDRDFKGMNKGYIDIIVAKLNEGGKVEWKKTIGGNGSDVVTHTSSTLDGGVFLTGNTGSNDGDFKGLNRGIRNIFVVKMDSHGKIQFTKTFGGSDLDFGHFITTTPDEGSVLIGSFDSNDGDFKGMNVGSSDIFVIKLDSNGNLQPSGKKSKKK